VSGAREAPQTANRCKQRSPEERKEKWDSTSGKKKPKPANGQPRETGEAYAGQYFPYRGGYPRVHIEKPRTPPQLRKEKGYSILYERKIIYAGSLTPSRGGGADKGELGKGEFIKKWTSIPGGCMHVKGGLSPYPYMGCYLKKNRKDETRGVTRCEIASTKGGKWGKFKL